MIPQNVPNPTAHVIYTTFEGLNDEEQDQIFTKVAEVFLSRIGLKGVVDSYFGVTRNTNNGKFDCWLNNSICNLDNPQAKPLHINIDELSKKLSPEIRKIRAHYPTKPFGIVFTTTTLDLAFTKIFKTLGISCQYYHIPFYYRIQVIRSSTEKTFKIREDILGDLVEERSFSIKIRKNELDQPLNENHNTEIQ